MNFTILHFEAIGSTNDEALRQARLGADEGLCIVADEQTKGRGRHGRMWVSANNAGLYFSLVLRPKMDLRYLPMITLMAGVAVHDTLEKLYGFDADIKWANDILVNEKKISGILCETCETPKGQAVIVGIGINLKLTNFPPEIAETATSIEAEYGSAPDREELLQSLTGFLDYTYAELLSPNGIEKIRHEWAKRSSYANGKNVRVIQSGEEFTGITRGIEENGALKIVLETGESRIIHAGDIERLRSAS